MAANETHPIWEILHSFGIESLVLAFCLSMLVGLLIGVLIFILLTWLSRHRASAVITRPSKRKSNTSYSLAHNRMGLYRSHALHHLGDNSLVSAHLNLRRQTSVDTDELLGRKTPFQASTFHPGQNGGTLRAKSPPSSPSTQEIEPSSSSEGSLLPTSGHKRQSFWLGNNGLRGYLPTQTPPPAYDSVIHAFQETET
ncbi:myc target protein 1 homolog [Clupea harengus]|uniref:Myc target protein 1 homolog n=1 Tax=Clupea harengus TaxID=7950 RepID=A0A6P3WA39_CLUHA|nr:myc target protein 1 homolog [Clupea harengus]